MSVETTIVPPLLRPGDTARVHVVLRPNAANKAHWNNEAEELVLWASPPSGWSVDSSRITVPIPPEAISDEVRTVELEVASPSDAATITLPTYALYYVCEDVDRTCLYRRQDIPIELQVRVP